MEKIISYYQTYWKSGEKIEESWKSIDTVIEGYRIYQFKYLPFEPITRDEEIDENIYASSYKYLIKPEFGERRILTNSIGWMNKSFDDDSCWYEDKDYDHLGPGEFVEGCGLSFLNVTNFQDIFEHTKRLVYYIKGEEIWGNPIIISVEEKKSVGSFILFPNPVKGDDIITIRNQSPISKVKIIDILGKERIELNTDFQNEIKIKLDNLESGLYFIIIFDSANNIISNKLIVR